MIRKAFLMSVKPGMEQEYQRRHEEIWPELASTLKAHGASNYSIFLAPRTHQLFGYVEIDSEERWNLIAETSICQKWWAYMQEIMPANPDNSPVCQELKSVFYLA